MSMSEWKNLNIDEVLDIIERNERLTASDIITGGFKTIRANLKEVIRETATLLHEKNRPKSVTGLQQDRQDQPNQSITT